MTESPNANEHQTAPETVLPNSVVRRIKLARLSLWWERAWPALWPALGLLGLYMLLALTGLLEARSSALAWITLLLLISGMAALLRRQRTAFHWPSWEEALRRLEAMNGLAHQPLSTYQDAAATGTGSDTLWQAHRAWLKKHLAALKLRTPSPGLAARDPMALRAALLLSLIAAFVVAGPQALPRLQSAFLPDSTANEPPGRLDAWITPPDYTNQPPIFLTQETAPELTIPSGSKLTLQVFGGSPPHIEMTPNEGATEALALEPRAAQTGSAYDTIATLTQDMNTRLIQDGRELGRWTFLVTADAAPQIELLDNVTATRTNTLKFNYRVQDDYGVAGVTAEFALDPFFTREDARIFQLGEEPANRTGFSPLIDGFVAEKVETKVDLPLTSLRPKDTTETTYKDLSSHPWAGLPVRIELFVHDDAKQTGKSRMLTLTLPARVFTKPLAAALIEQRQRLALTPTNRGSVAGFLNAFAAEPDIFDHDASVYLGLRAAYWRLTKARRPGDLDGLSSLLWDLAIYIEDGDLSRTESELRAAREALASALAEGASADEIEQLMQELKQALAAYLDQLAGQTQSAEQQFPEWPGDTTDIDRSDLEELLDQIGDLARTGARDQAQELLAQLDEILENLNTSDREMGPSQEEAELADAIKEIGEIIKLQQTLMDKTFQHNQGSVVIDGSDPNDLEQSGDTLGEDTKPPGSVILEDLNNEQQAVRIRLEKLIGKLAEDGQPTFNNLEEAVLAMGQAEDRLTRKRPDRAVLAQARAIELLSKGAQSLAEKMLEIMIARGTQPSDQQGDGSKTDPLGRRWTDGTDGDVTDNVKMPSADDLQLARQILEELRKRAAELGRPQTDLDYLERLLRRF